MAAEVLASVPAWLTLAAGSAVGDDDGLALGVSGSGAGADDGAGDLVAERRRQGQHGRMAATAVDLDVGAACGRGVDPDQEFARPRLGHRKLPELEAAGTREERLILVPGNHGSTDALGE